MGEYLGSLLTLTQRKALGYAHLPQPPMHYTVQQLADLAGITVRTLHHYDEIGLLRPARGDNNYRSYGEAELLRLQQILFYRELDVPLTQIAAIIDAPDFDLQQALIEHREKISRKQLRLAGLLGTIDNTLLRLSGNKPLSDDQLFEAFWEKHESEYAPEAKARWGHTDAFAQSQERTKHLTKDDYKRIASDSEALTQALAHAMPSGPSSTQTQELIAQHYQSLRTFYDPSPELYRGLGRMYVEDPRFRAYYERFDARMPEFMREAMEVFCKGTEQAETTP